MARIGFIGLGNMGAPMATNLLKAGHTVSVFDIVPSAIPPLAELGATPTTSAAATTAEADVVITMLPASQQVAELYLAEGGLLAQASAPTILVDCSTIAPTTSRAVAGAAASRGLQVLDAPVSGGTGGARAGTLTFIVGGEAATVDAVRPMLLDMGANVLHAGGAGAGQVAKFCNNLLLAILMTGTAEALALGVANGLDPALLSDIMKKSSGRNWALEQYNPWPGVMDGAPASNGFQGGFAVDLMLKDLGLATDAAVASRSAIPLGALARDLYAMHSAAGNGRLDFSSIVRLFQPGD